MTCLVTRKTWCPTSRWSFASIFHFFHFSNSQFWCFVEMRISRHCWRKRLRKKLKILSTKSHSSYDDFLWLEEEQLIYDAFKDSLRVLSYRHDQSHHQSCTPTIWSTEQKRNIKKKRFELEEKVQQLKDNM